MIPLKVNSLISQAKGDKQTLRVFGCHAFSTQKETEVHSSLVKEKASQKL